MIPADIDLSKENKMDSRYDAPTRVTKRAIDAFLLFYLSLQGMELPISNIVEEHMTIARLVGIPIILVYFLTSWTYKVFSSNFQFSFAYFNNIPIDTHSHCAWYKNNVLSNNECAMLNPYKAELYMFENTSIVYALIQLF